MRRTQNEEETDSAQPGPEVYDPARKAELLLNNAVDEEDYQRICEEVRRLGLDPASIPHDRPDG